MILDRAVFINSFLVNVLILYSLKVPGIQMFSGISRGYEMETLSWNGLTYLKTMLS